MSRSRLFVSLLLALGGAAVLHAQAPAPATFRILGDNRLQEEDPAYGDVNPGKFNVGVTGQVKTRTTVTWSASFPAIGFTRGGTMTFEAGQSGDSFTIYFPWDGMHRDAHEGTVSISWPGGSDSKTIEVWYWWPELIIDDLRVAESDEDQATAVRLSRASHNNYTLVFSAIDGSATSGDFTLLDGAIGIPAGQTGTMVRFRAHRDGLAEGEETFRISGQSAELLEGYPQIGSGYGTITIDDAEIGVELAPADFTVFNGDSFEIYVTLSRGLAATAAITSSDTRIARPSRSDVTFRANDPTASFSVAAGEPGDATIEIAFPAELGIAPVTAQVHVFGGEFSFAIEELTVRKNEQGGAAVYMTPPPPQPVALPVQLSKTGVLRLHDSGLVGTDGAGGVSFDAIAIGTAEVLLMNPLGPEPMDVLRVRVIDALSAKSIAPQQGSTGGGTPVTISGTGFSGNCSVAFDGVAATNVAIVNETTLRAVTPAHAAGTVTARVVCDGYDAPLVSSFTFVKPPRSRSVRH